MAKRKSHRASRRPESHEEIREELLSGNDSGPFPLEKHLHGCLIGYQVSTQQKGGKAEIGDGTYFAFEAIWGIVKAKREGVEPGEDSEADAHWGLTPLTPVEVPWMWLVFLAKAWERSDHGETPIGKALGLEGSRGQRPKHRSMTRLLNERAIAIWIHKRSQELRTAGVRAYVQTAQNEAGDRWGRSFDAIRKIWERHGPAVRAQRKKVT